MLDEQLTMSFKTLDEEMVFHQHDKEHLAKERVEKIII